MILGEGGGKLADQLNAQITELHKRLPPQLRPFLEDQFDTGYDSDSCDSNGSRDSYDDRKFEAKVTPILLRAVRKDPCSTKPTSGVTKPELKPKKISSPRLPTVLFRPAWTDCRPTGANSRSRQRRRKRQERRVILGGTRTGTKYSGWRNPQCIGQDRALNKKRTARSIAEGAAHITLTTQIMTPAPRKKKHRHI